MKITSIIPFTSGWVRKHVMNYLKMSLKKKTCKSYKRLRKEIHGICCFFGMHIPINNILVLKNYHSKKTVYISIKPPLSNKKILFVILNYENVHIRYLNKKFNEFVELPLKEFKK